MQETTLEYLSHLGTKRIPNQTVRAHLGSAALGIHMHRCFSTDKRRHGTPPVLFLKILLEVHARFVGLKKE